MINFLISMLLLVLVLYVVYLVIGMLKLPEEVKSIAYLIIGIVVLLILLQWFTGFAPTWPNGPPWR